ncbi:hypothetical protein GGX14DRAFT_372393, partial [Mycena pura]
LDNDQLEEESDDESALRGVEESERAGGKRRGPENASLQHFRQPVAVIFEKKKKWEIRCKYCKSVRRVERTIDHGDFEDEPKMPALNNLAGHTRQCSEKKKADEAGAAADGPPPTLPAFNTSQAGKIMENFLREGELNPAIVPTAKGFLRLIAAWIIDEDLPWTAGEAPSLAVLFKIFAELHGKVVRELHAIDSWVCEHREFRTLILGPSDWKFLTELGQLLDIFSEVTLQMSHANIPTIPFVLPLYLRMKQVLQAHVLNPSILPQLRTAVLAGMQKLEKYHALARDNQFYRLGTSVYIAVPI